MTRDVESRRRAFVERQFALQNDRGAVSIPAAADALRRALPADCRADIDRLEAELGGRVISPSTERADLVGIVAAARERGGASLAAYDSYRKLRAASQQSLDGLMIGIWAQVQYLLAVLLVLMVVAGVYSAFVFPALTDIYGSFGLFDNALTVFLFGRVRLIWILTLLAVGFVLGARWILARMHRRLDSGEMLPQWFDRWPLLGAVMRGQRRWLALQWMLVLGDAGVAWAAAREAARERFGNLADLDSGTLEAAEALGTLRPELLAQIDLQLAELFKAVTRTRVVLVYAVRLIVYLVIAIAVIGMYAPIFGLGEMG